MRPWLFRDVESTGAGRLLGGGWTRDEGIPPNIKLRVGKCAFEIRFQRIDVFAWQLPVTLNLDRFKVSKRCCAIEEVSQRHVCVDEHA